MDPRKALSVKSKKTKSSSSLANASSWRPHCCISRRRHIYAPKYGNKSIWWSIMVCSMIGGVSVSVTNGLGSAIVATTYGDNQFKSWIMNFPVFVITTLLTEIYYLYVALALFNTAMGTPTCYALSAFFSMITTIVLLRGLKASAKEVSVLVMGFLVVHFAIAILRMPKVDPLLSEVSSARERRGGCRNHLPTTEARAQLGYITTLPYTTLTTSGIYVLRKRPTIKFCEEGLIPTTIDPERGTERRSIKGAVDSGSAGLGAGGCPLEQD